MGMDIFWCINWVVLLWNIAWGFTNGGLLTTAQVSLFGSFLFSFFFLWFSL